MADARELVVPVPIRCCAPGSDRSPLGICGAAASWVCPRLDATVAYRCDVHREPGDAPIDGVAIVRRISIVAEVVFNGAVPGRSEAEYEALLRFADAVAAVNGVISLHTVSSDIGRQPAPAPVAAAKRGRGRG